MREGSVWCDVMECAGQFLPVQVIPRRNPGCVGPCSGRLEGNALWDALTAGWGAADGRAFGCRQVLACAGIARDLSVVRSILVQNYSHGKCWSAPAPSRTTLPVKRVLAGAQVVFGVSSAEP